MNLTIAPVEDADELRTLLPFLERAAEATRATYDEDPCPADTAARFVKRGKDRAETLYLAARDESGRVVAVAVSGAFEDPLTAEPRPMLTMLYVDPSLRHRGVARALVDELGRRLARRGFDSFLARAGHNDDVLISMGERLGLVRSFEVLSSE